MATWSFVKKLWNGSIEEEVPTVRLKSSEYEYEYGYEHGHEHEWEYNSTELTCATTGYFLSTSAPMTEPLFRSYVEKEVEDPACPYCGNLSKLRDPRGNCIACGGPRR